MMSIDPYLTPSPQSTTSLDPNLIRAILNPILPAVMRVEEGFQLVSLLQELHPRLELTCCYRRLTILGIRILRIMYCQVY